MDTITLQVPIDKAIKDEATRVAKEEGFSSLQDVVRLFVTRFSRRQVAVNLTEELSIQLSPKAIDRYARIDKDVASNKNLHSFESVEDMMQFLSK